MEAKGIRGLAERRVGREGCPSRGARHEGKTGLEVEKIVKKAGYPAEKIQKAAFCVARLARFGQ